jgi:hypothetical protein
MFHVKKLINMVHQCKVQCHTVDPKTAEDLGIEDNGKWLPFLFNMDTIDAAKESSDDSDSPTYKCTTIYTNNGNTFIIDTPFDEFQKKYIEFNTFEMVFKNILPPDEEGTDGKNEDDLEL